MVGFVLVLAQSLRLLWLCPPFFLSFVISLEGLVLPILCELLGVPWLTIFV